MRNVPFWYEVQRKWRVYKAFYASNITELTAKRQTLPLPQAVAGRGEFFIQNDANDRGTDRIGRSRNRKFDRAV